MDVSAAFLAIGFLTACWAVVSNDSVQTLGTFLASNRGIRWYWLYLASALVLVATLWWGWSAGDGDVSWGRLAHVPRPEVFTIWHALGPLALLALTYWGIPVSTTFLVLSVFASNAVIGKMVATSVLGYAIALVFAFLLWHALRRVVDERRPATHPRTWQAAQ